MFAAVVVLYNPDHTILENIASYIDCVSFIYIVDNSDLSNESVFLNSSFKNKLSYVFNNGNLGIAKALNIGCRMAINAGVEWVLTMDQDSNFSVLNNQMISSISNANDAKIALYYPDYLIDDLVYDRYIKENNEPIVVMTSGNVINLNIYNTIGGFEDKLFIDYVDIDYCLKIKKAGYKISNLPGAVLKHELGQSKHISFFSIKAIVTNHSSLRRYYITRNRLYVKNKKR